MTHTDEDVANYLAAAKDALQDLNTALQRDSVMAEIDNILATPPFRRLS